MENKKSVVPSTLELGPDWTHSPSRPTAARPAPNDHAPLRRAARARAPRAAVCAAGHRLGCCCRTGRRSWAAVAAAHTRARARAPVLTERRWGTLCVRPWVDGGELRPGAAPAHRAPVLRPCALACHARACAPRLRNGRRVWAPGAPVHVATSTWPWLAAPPWPPHPHAATPGAARPPARAPQLDLLPAPPLAQQVTASAATTTSNAVANSTWGISVVGCVPCPLSLSLSLSLCPLRPWRTSCCRHQPCTHSPRAPAVAIRVPRRLADVHTCTPHHVLADALRMRRRDTARARAPAGRTPPAPTTAT